MDLQSLSLRLLAWWQNATQRDDSEEGQTLIEYGLIIALISIVAIIALTATGTSLKNIFSSISGKLHS